jgi:hypothetical protein
MTRDASREDETMAVIASMKFRVRSKVDCAAYGTVVGASTFSATIRWDDGELTDTPFSKLENAFAEPHDHDVTSTFVHHADCAGTCGQGCGGSIV